MKDSEVNLASGSDDPNSQVIEDCEIIYDGSEEVSNSQISVAYPPKTNGSWKAEDGATLALKGERAEEKSAESRSSTVSVQGSSDESDSGDVEIVELEPHALFSSKPRVMMGGMESSSTSSGMRIVTFPTSQVTIPAKRGRPRKRFVEESPRNSDAPDLPGATSAANSATPFKVVCERTYRYIEPEMILSWKSPWKRANKKKADGESGETPAQEGKGGGSKEKEKPPSNIRKKVDVREVVMTGRRMSQQNADSEEVELEEASSLARPKVVDGVLPVEVKANHVAVVTIFPGSAWPKSIVAMCDDPTELQSNAKIILVKGTTVAGGGSSEDVVVRYVPEGMPIPNNTGVPLKAQLFERTPSQIKKIVKRRPRRVKIENELSETVEETAGPETRNAAASLELVLDESTMVVGDDVEVETEVVECETVLNLGYQNGLCAARGVARGEPKQHLGEHDYTGNTISVPESSIETSIVLDGAPSAEYERLVREALGTDEQGAGLPAIVVEAGRTGDKTLEREERGRQQEMAERRMADGEDPPLRRRKRHSESPGWVIALERRLYHGKMEDVFVCSKCTSFRTLTAAVMVRHLEWHKNGMMFVCDKCDFRATMARTLHKHTREAHAPKWDASPVQAERKPNNCELCGFVPTSIGSEYAHRKMHYAGREVKCGLCSQVFTMRGDARRHVASAHAGDRLYKCEDCDMTTCVGKDYLSHMKRHAPPMRCAHCAFETRSKPSLVEHISSHWVLSEGILILEEAGSGAASEGNKQSGEQATPGAQAQPGPPKKKQYFKKRPKLEIKCPYCDFVTATRKGELTKHLRTVHCM